MYTELYTCIQSYTHVYTSVFRVIHMYTRSIHVCTSSYTYIHAVYTCTYAVYTLYTRLYYVVSHSIRSHTQLRTCMYVCTTLFATILVVFHFYTHVYKPYTSCICLRYVVDRYTDVYTLYIRLCYVLKNSVRSCTLLFSGIYMYMNCIHCYISLHTCIHAVYMSI